MLKIRVESDPSFYVDSGTTTLMINDANKLFSLELYEGNAMFFVGDGNALPIS